VPEGHFCFLLSSFCFGERMSDKVISVEHLSKRYRLGMIGHTALHEDLSRWWARLRGRPDPTLRLDQLQRMELKRAAAAERDAADPDHVWALRDVSFEVRQGEVLGIIGRNGAGKSTLLKILTRVTAPTMGTVKMKGRVASLLEVGTGFHPELTGRDNIFLNGTILGMTRAEVRRRFDEIVAFAEIEKFIDTPVKRYSSGMYVRLAFAIAAHLEPDILLVDEVLAVGDAAFQKRCLGKMKDVALGGRTVLFVSHNMKAVQALCRDSLLLDGGRLAFMGNTAEAVSAYISTRREGAGCVHVSTGAVSISEWKAAYRECSPSQHSLTLDLVLSAATDLSRLYCDFGVENANGVRMIQVVPAARNLPAASVAAGGSMRCRVEIDTAPFAPGRYFGTVVVHSSEHGLLLHHSEVPLFAVSPRPECPECASRGFSAVLSAAYRYRVDEQGKVP
jgi:ABC-type polysaccharide/polyol phosphate transport system ATPase subunit